MAGPSDQPKPPQDPHDPTPTASGAVPPPPAVQSPEYDGEHLSPQRSAEHHIEHPEPFSPQRPPLHPSPSPRLSMQQFRQQQPDDSPKLSAQYSFPRISMTNDEEFEEKTVSPIPTRPRLDTLRAPMTRDSHDLRSPSSNARADASRLDDDLELLRAEKLISNQENDPNRPRRADRHNTEVEDAFNPTSTEEPEVVKAKDKNAPLYKVFLFLKKFPRFIRYFVYLIPGACLLLIPILLGALAIDEQYHPVGGYGGTPLMWFGIWLEIIWGSLWVGRMVTSLLPHVFHSVAKVSGSTNPKKWKDIGQQLELHTALFLWMLAVLVSFQPICRNHQVDVPKGHEQDVDRKWIDIVFKVIIAFFVLATLNFVEKILIQWIANVFHERTYATRILNNKGDIRQLVQLYEWAKSSLEETDSFWQGSGRQSTTGAVTPMQNLHEDARRVLGKVGKVAGRVGNDFIGRKVDENHPRKVVSELLRSTGQAHTLARLIYRSLVKPDQEMVLLEDMQQAFATEEEADAAFNVFDKDLNGDISMDEFEAVTNEIHLEKKAIAASLKDLDSVIQKLDKVFLFIILIITIIVFISIISGSAAAGLASAGSSVLGLAWMLQATAQEFLQSIIFVFVKHPFDVGDRVTIYGSTGATMTGDDYYVTEISLLYTEFKKLQGHVVQAPNSLLNTLFILNQRRSNGIANPIPLQIRFGTPNWQLEELKARMLEFTANNKRDFQPTILMELSAIADMRAATLTVVCIHKSNFQNELLRLARNHRFMMELMTQMHDIGIQSPYRVDPGGSRENPLHWTSGPPPPSYTRDHDQDLPPQGAPLQPTSSMRRPSMTSASARATMAAASNETAMNFQDVIENRRDHFLASRLASIREKNNAEKKHEEVIKEVESEPRASASGLQKIESAGSQQARSRIWGRARSQSKAAAMQPHGGDAV